MPDETRPRRGRPRSEHGGVDTRARITASAAQLFRRRGYGSTGLNDVVRESRAPKGSLYHYFPGGKEQLASEAIDRGAGVVTGVIEAAFASHPDTGDVLREVARLLARNLERSGFRDGCPVATVTLDAASDSDAIQAACGRSFAAWRDAIAAQLGSRGYGEDEAGEVAVLLLSSFEGALVMARATRDVTPLFVVADTLIERGVS